MSDTKTYEKYPPVFIKCTITIQILLYVIGASLIYQYEKLFVIFYIMLIFILEIRLLRYICINCYYYDKACAFGRGKIATLLFKKGISERFKNKKITTKDIIPDFLVSIIPIIFGILLLFNKFNWFILAMIIFLLILAFPLSGFIRGKISCNFCMQRKIGCPAEQLFNKKKNA